MKVENFKRFSLKMLHCEARAFPVGMAIYKVGHFFYSAENAHAYKSGFLGRRPLDFASSIIHWQ